MTIQPAKSIQGEITLPGDKSISHRAAIIASMASGETRVENFSTGEDCASTLRCLRQLGVDIEQNGRSLRVRGVGITGFRAPTGPLDCGNSGTTMRLLAGVLAGQTFGAVLTGDDSLRKRPMDRIIEPLRRMGADISANAGRPPITIKPVERLEGIEYAVPVASAQVKSCVLLAGLYARGETTVWEDVATRDHTERMLCGFGVDVQTGEIGTLKFVSVSRDSALSARNITIPGDISAAAFPMAAAACFPDSELTLTGLGLNPTRRSILDLLIECGAEIELTDQSTSAGEPLATVMVRGMRSAVGASSLISGVRTAEMIDELPIIAILGTQLENGLTVRDATELRLKETDRIAAVVENLRRMDANVEEFEDGFKVGRSELKAAEIEPFGDHRIAMAFAVAGLLAVGETTIKDKECVDISFPGFFETLESVVKR